MITIQFIDAQTGENMTELGSREWPHVPEVGEELVFTNPARRCKVVGASWIDLASRREKVIARVELEEVAGEGV